MASVLRSGLESNSQEFPQASSEAARLLHGIHLNSSLLLSYTLLELVTFSCFRKLLVVQGVKRKRDVDTRQKFRREPSGLD
ncbi:uncharacterized [Tachysurus ichikawai]